MGAIGEGAGAAGAQAQDRPVRRGRALPRRDEVEARRGPGGLALLERCSKLNYAAGAAPARCINGLDLLLPEELSKFLAGFGFILQCVKQLGGSINKFGEWLS